MPRMPTDQEIGLPGIASRSIRRGVTDPRGAAMQDMGQAIASGGQKVAAMLGRHSAERDSLELARARADWNTRRLNEDSLYSLDQSPDYGKWEGSYTGNIEKHRKASGALISNPKVREQFELETSDDVTRGTLSVRQRAKAIGDDKLVAEGFEAIDKNLGAAARADTPPEEANRIIAQTRADIDNMVASGLITPAKGIELRQKYTTRFASLKVQQDIESDPKRASGYLNSGGAQGGAKGVIRHFEGYRSKPYYDVNAYRAGYGSDTVTRADGSVVKVKPGMMVTREDAERDLDRRIGEFQAGIVKEVGPDKWAGLSPNAKAALTSVAWNYGSLPGSVVNAIKGGDVQQIAEAVNDLSGHNNGINAKRRAQEAAMILGGGDSLGADMQPPAYYDFLEPEDRFRLTSAAEGEWTARDNEQKQATALDRYRMTSLMEDDVSQIENTGKATDLDPNEALPIMGEADTAKWLEKRDTAAMTYEAVSVMDTMTNDQMEEHVSGLEPKAGDDDFDRRQSIYEKAEKRSDTLQKLRLEDPAKAVADAPVVVEALKGWKPDDPASSQTLVRARLAAQSSVQIPPAMQQPITRGEAKELIAPIERIIDMQDAALVAAMSDAKGDSAARRAAAKAVRQQAEDEIRATVDNIEKIYGPYAPKVLAFAIAESVRDKEIGDLTSQVWRKVAKGQKPSRVEMQGLDAATEASTAEKAINGELPAPQNSIKQAVQPERTVQPSTGRGGERQKYVPKEKFGPYAEVTDRAVEALIQNPQLADEFDKLYGPGAAAKWMPKTVPPQDQGQ